MTPAARLLDLSRLASRGLRVPTGVDRVERAYLEALTADPVPVFGLVRTALGYLILDRAGMVAFATQLRSGDLAAPRLVDRLARRHDPGRAAVEGALRRHAIARSPHRGLPRLLRRCLPAGTSYVNVGQTSLSAQVLTAVRTLPGARIAVMVHDTIPLDHPEWQSPGSGPALARRLALASRMADLVLTNSRAVAADCRRHMAALGRVPELLPVHLGVDLATPAQGHLPAGLDLLRPRFVTVSTVEPRKNHALLLDVWDMLGDDAPDLYILGTRGWCNDAVFRRLDAGLPHVIELAGLDDRAVAALTCGARAALVPSLAEGYGLPALEAAARGVPWSVAIWPSGGKCLAMFPFTSTRTTGIVGATPSRPLSIAPCRLQNCRFRNGAITSRSC